MLTTVKLVIPGDPQGKGRPRYSKATRRMYTPAETVAYEKLIQALYYQAYSCEAFPKGEPLEMLITAFCPAPQSDSLKIRAMKLCGKIGATVKPDWDNIGKIVSDALNKVAYYDDNQIVDARVRKFYSDRPRVEITIMKAKEI